MMIEMNHDYTIVIYKVWYQFYNGCLAWNFYFTILNCFWIDILLALRKTKRGAQILRNYFVYFYITMMSLMIISYYTVKKLH